MANINFRRVWEEYCRRKKNKRRWTGIEDLIRAVLANRGVFPPDKRRKK